jgi:hypothetical membrane protein
VARRPACRLWGLTRGSQSLRRALWNGCRCVVLVGDVRVCSVKTIVFPPRERRQRARSYRRAQCPAVEPDRIHNSRFVVGDCRRCNCCFGLLEGVEDCGVWLLIISGLAFAGTGVFPAEMRDGAVVVTSASTRWHFIMSLVHGIAWVIAAMLLVVPMKRSANWRGWFMVNVALVALVLVALFGLRGRLSDALVQRIAGALYFAWFFVLSFRLFQLGSSTNVRAAV